MDSTIIRTRSSSAPASPGTQMSRLGAPLVNEIVIG